MCKNMNVEQVYFPAIGQMPILALQYNVVYFTVYVCECGLLQSPRSWAAIMQPAGNNTSGAYHAHSRGTNTLTGAAHSFSKETVKPKVYSKAPGARSLG